MPFERNSKHPAILPHRAYDTADVVTLAFRQMSLMGQGRPDSFRKQLKIQSPLSEQIADATIPRGQCRSWVGLKVLVSTLSCRSPSET